MKKILLAEDDPETVEVLKMLFVAAGYAIEVATNAKAVLETLAQAGSEIGCVLLDMSVTEAGMKREEFFKQFREKQIPFAIHSGHDMRVLLPVAAENNAFAILRKPADIRDMLDTVKQMLLFAPPPSTTTVTRTGEKGCSTSLSVQPARTAHST